MESTGNQHAEQRARVLIDRQLELAGWRVCDRAELDLVHHPSTAVREVRMKPGHGQVDYLLYVDRKIAGVIEAKPVGTPLTGVEWQSAMYATGLTPEQQLQAVTHDDRLQGSTERRSRPHCSELGSRTWVRQTEGQGQGVIATL